MRLAKSKRHMQHYETEQILENIFDQKTRNRNEGKFERQDIYNITRNESLQTVFCVRWKKHRYLNSQDDF